MSIKNQLVLASSILSTFLFCGVFLLDFSRIELFKMIFYALIPLILIRSPKFLSDFLKSEEVSQWLGWFSLIIIFIHLIIYFIINKTGVIK